MPLVPVAAKIWGRVLVQLQNKERRWRKIQLHQDRFFETYVYLAHLATDMRWRSSLWLVSAFSFTLLMLEEQSIVSTFSATIPEAGL